MYISCGEHYPVFDIGDIDNAEPFDNVYEIDDIKLIRWKKVIAAYDAVQNEISDFIGYNED